MTSTVTAIAPATPRPLPAAQVDADAVQRVAVTAAREITGVAHDVRARAKLARGAATLSLRVPVYYPMPIWQVTTACRAQVLRRMRERTRMPVRRLDIDVVELPECPR